MRYIILLLLCSQLGMNTIQALELEQRYIIRDILETHERVCMLELKVVILEGVKR